MSNRISFINLEQCSPNKATAITGVGQVCQITTEEFCDPHMDGDSTTADLQLVPIHFENDHVVAVNQGNDHNPSPPSHSSSTSRVQGRISDLDQSLGFESAHGSSMRQLINIPATNFHTSRWRMGMVLVCLVIAAAAAGMISLLVTMNDKSATPDQAAPSTSSEPTYLEQLQSQFLGSQELFLGPNSHQMQAMTWLAMVDEPRLNLTATNLQQRYALMVLWYAQGGIDWQVQGWAKPGVHECEWQFLKCNENDWVVEIIQEQGMKLTGSLASEIGMLIHLEVLNFQSCYLEGDFPKEFFILTNLNTMIFSDNQMTSTISASIANFSQLEVFDVSNNYFTGSLPSNFSSVLRSFIVSSNEFTGNPWPILLKWPDIQIVDFSDTLTFGTIPTEIGLLTDLVSLEFYGTDSRGRIPSEIGYLKELSIFHALSTGTIPTELALCTKLTSLDLSNSMLPRGTIPTVLGYLVLLELLVLYRSSFTGTIPTELAKLVNMKDVFLNSNFLTGTIPTEFAAFDGSILQSADFSRNRLTGDLPDSFCPRVKVDCGIGCGACGACVCV